MHGLRIAVLAMLVLAAISLAGIALDDRQLQGVTVWLKPLKYGTSPMLMAR